METSHSLDTFFQSAYRDVEGKIQEVVSDEKILSILHGGKRLRPLLALLSFKVCTGGEETPERYQAVLEEMVGVELAHNASLIHDDIIDGDVKRRGELAFYLKEGIDNAILIGHKMLAIGFNLALAHGEKIAKLYVDTWNETLTGQLTEVNFNTKDLYNTKSITSDSKFFQIYSTIINLKTASLFSSACKAAAYEAHVSDELAGVLGMYGREVGFSYQLADDLADLEKGERIDSVVIPLLARLEKKSLKNGSMNGKMLRKKLEKNLPEIKVLYLSEIKKHLRRAEELCQSSVIPSNQYKVLLREAPPYIINMMLKEIEISI
ncbi:MAG: polyprenyl synthetase family protein [Methanobacteriota archaeon]